MPEIKVIWGVNQNTMGGEDGRFWEVWSLKPDGTNDVHGFPLSTLEQRVAEYDLDPGDVDEVLDIILHERYVPPPLVPSNMANDAAKKKGLVTRLKVDMPGVMAGTEVPATLLTADTVEQARQAHKLRVEEAKTRVLHIPHTKAPKSEVAKLAGRPITPGDPLDVIRKNHGITQSGVDQRKEMVRRRRLGYQGFPKDYPDERRPPRPPVRSESHARRVQDMVESNQITVAPTWVTVALSQE